MCEGTSDEYSAKFLRRLCIIHSLNCEEFILTEISKAFKFTSDSLTLNFINCYPLGTSQDFRVLVSKTLQLFCHFQLKKIYISHLDCQGIKCELLNNLISSKSSSLTEILLKNNSIDNSMGRTENIHLPNIERVAFYAGKYFNPAWKFLIGKKLKSVEGLSKYFMFAFHSDQNNYFQFEKNNLLRFFKNYPDLESILNAKTERFEHNDSTKIAFKSLRNLRIFDFHIQGQIEEYIGSKIIEKLCFHQETKINWKFIRSLDKLVHLEIRSKFDPNEAFINFLKLDRLIELSLSHRIFPKRQEKVFFATIQNLKTLKVLHTVNTNVHQPCLGSSVEVLSIEIASENLTRLANKSKYLETTLSLLPTGKGVKILNIKAGDYMLMEVSC